MYFLFQQLFMRTTCICHVHHTHTHIVREGVIAHGICIPHPIGPHAYEHRTCRDALNLLYTTVHTNHVHMPGVPTPPNLNLNANASHVHVSGTPHPPRRRGFVTEAELQLNLVTELKSLSRLRKDVPALCIGNCPAQSSRCLFQMAST